MKKISPIFKITGIFFFLISLSFVAFAYEGEGDLGEDIPLTVSEYASSYELARGFVQQRIDTMDAEQLRWQLEKEYLYLENLSIGQGFPLLRTRRDIIDMYDTLRPDFETLMDEENAWFFIINYNEKPTIFFTFSEQGNGIFEFLRSSAGATDGFEYGLARFREIFPNDEVRIYRGPRWFYFITEDYSTLKEVPPWPLGSLNFSQQRAGFAETMDANEVAEILLERAETADLVRRGVIESLYGDSSLAEQYHERVANAERTLPPAAPPAAPGLLERIFGWIGRLFQ